jgi:flagellar hook-basal body protein
MSFYTSLTGLNAATAMLGVTSNNIANVGTTGFKRSRADFGDIFATSPLQKASSTVGQGVSLKQVSQEFGQGNISFSSNALDLAITGDGFFPMRSADGLQETYTRNGSFLLNEQYNVVNSAGQRLMAATVDSTGSANVNDRVVLTIPQKTSGEAKQTSAVSLGLNFPSDAPVISAAFNRTNPATYNKSTAFTVYDAGGNGYLATVYYVKTKNADSISPTNTWQTQVFVGDNAVNASLQQATDSNGQKLYVNQYGQLQPYSEVKDELTTAKTQLFSLNELTDKQNSVPAAVTGKSVSTASFDFSNGVNFAAKNADANTASVTAAKATGTPAAAAASTTVTSATGYTASYAPFVSVLTQANQAKINAAQASIDAAQAAAVTYTAISTPTDAQKLTYLTALNNAKTKLTAIADIDLTGLTTTTDFKTAFATFKAAAVTAVASATEIAAGVASGASSTTITSGITAAGTFNTKIGLAETALANATIQTVLDSAGAVALMGSTTFVDTISTATALNKGYPSSDQSDKYASELNAYMTNTANLSLDDSKVADKVAAARLAFDTAFSAKYGTDGYTATKEKIAAAVASAISAEILGVGATKAQIAAATRKATAAVIAYDNAVTQGIAAAKTALGLTSADLTTVQKTAITKVAIAAADGMKTSTNQDGFYNSVQAGLSHLFDVDVDGSGNPITLDMGYLATSETKVNGSELALAITNTLNKDFGGQSYFDLSSSENQTFQISTSNDNYTDPKTGVVTEYPIDVVLKPGITPGLGVTKNADGTIQVDDFGKPVYNEKKVTIDQMVDAIQTQLKAKGKTILVSYDYSSSQFKFTDGANTLKLKTADSGPNVNLKNPLFGLTQTAVTLVDGHYPGPNVGPITPVIPNGVAMRALADQRYGMEVTYDSVNKTFTTLSGKTGDVSSLKIEGVQPNSLAQNMMGLEANGLASDIPKNVVYTSATALRGIQSTPAIAVGTTPLKNISNNFTVDSSNNKFVVTVDGVKGTVVIPIRNDYSLDTFKAALQKGINAMGTTNANGDPTTVNGVEVKYDDTNKRFTFTSGTTGAASFVKISGSADWGLDQVEAARGADSTWIKPTQHKDKVSGVDQPKFIDGQGNETTSGDGFLNLPSWSPVFLTKGELTFNTSGKLVSPIQGTQLEPVYLAGGKGVLTININYSASTQYTSPFAVLSQSQDGAPEGDLVGVTIGNDGLVSASFSNGTQKSLAKILLANFSSPVGLRQMGDSTFLASASSGSAKLGNAGSAGFGTLRAGATERANVDLTQELVDLITAQRNFQANAKAIETSSTMTSAIINLRA